MTNSLQNHINQITKKAKIKYLDISNRDLNGEANLSEFTTLVSLNSYNNKFQNLEFLNSLPNKNTLKKLNFFGNQLKEIDFAWLLSTFPNLESINIENNPVKTKNLNSLTSSQFTKLVQAIKDKKFRVVSWQGTILMDLLEYAQQLVNRGHASHHSHLQVLKTMVNHSENNLHQVKPVKEIKQNNSQISAKNPNTNNYFLVGGLILLLGSVLAIGYWLGKRKNEPKLDKYIFITKIVV